MYKLITVFLCGSVVHAVSEISHSHQALITNLNPGTGTSSTSRFSRGAGFWTHPDDENRSDYFGKLTEAKSQREDWYQVTPYMAEFWCAVSNIGFIYAGVQHKSPELLFAGVASLVSHSIPKQWLLHVDKLGVLIALTKLIREREVLKQNPKLLLPIALAGGVGLFDVYLARKRGRSEGHVLWHLCAAYAANEFLKNVPK